MSVPTLPIVNGTLLAAILPWPQWISYKKNENGKLFDFGGAMANLLEHFEEKLNYIKFLYVEPLERLWGERLPDGSYNGMIGMVQRNEVHVAVGPFDMMLANHRVVDFTAPLYYNPLSILVGNQNPQNPLFPFLEVFNGTVWLVLSLLLLTCILFYTFIGHNANPIPKIENLLSKAFMVFMAPLFNASCLEFEREGKRRSQRVLITFWKLGSRFICLALSAVFFSFLIVNKPGDFIKSFQDFERFPESIPLLTQGTGLAEFLEMSKIPGIIGILNKVRANPVESVLTYFVLVSNDTISKVLRRSEFFVIMEYSSLTKILHDRYKYQLPCGFHITSLTDFGTFYSFVVNKYLPLDLKENLTYLSINLVENGLLTRDIDMSSVNFERCLQNWDEEQIIQTHLSKLHGVFIFYFSGLLCAIIYFLRKETRICCCNNIRRDQSEKKQRVF